jgi:hypothetical protein
MKPAKTIGIVLIVLGVAGLIFGAINYENGSTVEYTTQTREPVNVSGFRFTAEKEQTKTMTVPKLLPLIVGGMAFVGGIAVVGVASKKSAE